MTRHVLDKAKPLDDARRAKAFVAIERESTPSKASQTLQRRDTTRGLARLKHFWGKARSS